LYVHQNQIRLSRLRLLDGFNPVPGFDGFIPLAESVAE
jgi:hypothetical protein